MRTRAASYCKAGGQGETGEDARFRMTHSTKVQDTSCLLNYTVGCSIPKTSFYRQNVTGFNQWK